MTPSSASRLLKFSLVGAIGIGVQLTVLAAVSASKVNYLLATAAAVESAVIHNFLWHRRFTWADRTRSEPCDFLNSLVRFHLSNGLISIVGNLLLMRWLVGDLQLPRVRANLLTIAICYAANFLASDHWVFRSRRESESFLTTVTHKYCEQPPASAPACVAQMEHRPAPPLRRAQDQLRSGASAKTEPMPTTHRAPAVPEKF